MRSIRYAVVENVVAVGAAHDFGFPRIRDKCKRSCTIVAPEGVERKFARFGKIVLSYKICKAARTAEIGQKGAETAIMQHLQM